MTLRHHYLSERTRTTVVPLVVVGFVFAAMVGVLLVTVDGGTGGGGPAAAPTTTIAPATPEDAITTWIASHRATVFPTYAGSYVGGCRNDGAAVEGLCSMFREDLGGHRIYGVGAAASDWGANVLLERDGAAGWAVIAEQTWPNIGDNDTGYYGSPWSPHTAIRRWLAGDASHTFPANSVYVGNAGAEAAIPTPQQTLLFGTLVAMSGEARVYSVYANGDTDLLYVRLVEAPDHSWTVTATAPARDGGARIPAPW